MRDLLTGLGALSVVCALVYFNSLLGAFQFDDHALLHKEWVADLSAFQQQVDVKSFQNRPILLFTFALNNSLHPNRVLGFHLVNLLLHTWVSLLIFFILLKTAKFAAPTLPQIPEVQNRPHDFSRHGMGLAFFCALLFALHPLNTDSVSYIASRSSLLATFFYLGTLYGFLVLFSWPRKLKKTAFRALGGLVLVVGSFLALGSKLIAATLPLALGLWFFAFICPPRFPVLWRFCLQYRKPLLGSAALLAAAALALMWGLGMLYTPKDQGVTLFGRTPYLMVQAKVIFFYYLKLFFAPINLNVDPGFPFSSLDSDLQIVFAWCGLSVLLFSALRWGNLWVKAGTLWFVLTLAPTSSLIPLNDLAVEHRLYLPMTLGLCLIAGCVWLRSLRRKTGPAALMGVLILFAALTVDRNRVWIDEFSLWADAARKNPHSPRPHNNLGKAFYEKGDLTKALFHFEKSVSIIPAHVRVQYNLSDPARWPGKEFTRQTKDKAAPARQVLVADIAEPHYNLASVYLDLGRLHEAEAEYQTALRLNPSHHGARLGLGSVQARLGRTDAAVASYLAAIESKRAASGGGDDALARLNLGEVYGRNGRYEEAIEQFQRALAANPSLALAHYNLGIAHAALEDWDRAEKHLSACLALNEDFEPALFHLARVYQGKKNWDASILYFAKLLKAKGPDAAAYYHIGFNHQQAGRWDQARLNYEKSLKLHSGFVNAHVNLGRMERASGNPEAARRHLKEALDLNPPPEDAEEIQRLLESLS